MRKKGLCCLAIGLALLLAPSAVLAQGHGGDHGGGGGGCGDVFGDLIHILRADTGQPILAQRWVELPAEVPGYGWGYCPIALDAAGNELPFLPYTCDVDLAAGTPVEVDYFGRLSAGRTKERNQRMHFNEVISNIKLADRVSVEETGRLKLGTCTVIEGVESCEWQVIDSPMENMAVYHRVMKYGHIQTDPDEPNLWWHGDPKLEPPMHPALDASDWAKFDEPLWPLLPKEPSEVSECFTDEGFNAACALNQALKKQDFAVVVAFLGGAAGKEGKITVDLVQYLNRILKITLDTTVKADGTPAPEGGTTPTVDQLPALVRDCWESEGVPADPPEDLPEGEVFPDPAYLPAEQCSVAAATSALPGYDLFYEVQEMFVDFGGAKYKRETAFVDAATGESKTMPLLTPAGDGLWLANPAVPLEPWLAYANPATGNTLWKDVDGFVKAASDALRAIQFVHNYAIPEALWDFQY